MTGGSDRLLRACCGESVDATPVWFMRQAGRSLPEYRAIRRRATLGEIVADPALCAEVTLQPVRRLGVDAAIMFADITTPLPGAGIAVDLVEGVGPVIAAPVTPATVGRLGAFDPAASVPGLLEAIAIVRREAGVPVIGFAGAPFTLAAYLIEGRSPRETVLTRRFLREAPAAWADLMSRLADLDIAYLSAQVDAGVQVVQVFDSWVGSLSPRDYRVAVLPHMQRLFAGLRGRGVPTVHFGTGTAGLLEAMAEAGGDVIGLDWRVDLAAAWSRLPGRAVQGNLDPTALLGPWPSVEDAARAVLAGAAGKPGHIFNLGHGVLPETDPDVLRRLVDLVHAETASSARTAE